MSLHPGHCHQGEPENNFILKIISYGHSNGPLVVPDNPNRVKLLYSVRDVSNPPNLLRKKYSGMSRRLQKEIFLSKQGKARMEQILECVDSQMVKMTEDYSRAPTPEIVTDADVDASKESPRELVVGIMCEEGRHRSVAFAEELGKTVTKKPRWVIEVQHRDLDDIGSSEEDKEDGNNEKEGSVSPRLGKRSSKAAKHKDMEKKKMLGKRISAFVDGDF
ncbi:MAG: hypothetical protein Q9195_009251 [Heterodermia aff. obscurata]